MKYKTSFNALTIEGVQFKVEDGVVDIPDALAPCLDGWVGNQWLIPFDENADGLAIAPPPIPGDDRAITLPPISGDDTPVNANQDETAIDAKKRGRKSKTQAKAQDG